MKLFNITLIALCAFVFLACNQAAPTASPTEVFKSQNEAQKKKDGATMKANLSKASLEMIGKVAKSQNKSIDEVLAMDVPGVKQPDKLDFRNEKIEGDTASVEIKAADTEEWAKLPFVKEDGRWKIALDKLLEETKRAQQEAVKASEDSNTTNTNTATNTANANTKK